MTVEVKDIVWDTDGEDVKLPSSTMCWYTYPNGALLSEEEVEDVLDEVSQRFGFCIKSANYVCHDSD